MKSVDPVWELRERVEGLEKKEILTRPRGEGRKTVIAKLPFQDFAAAYCERQEQTPSGLREILQQQIVRFQSEGFMLLECQMFDSSKCGSLTILGYGGKHTFKEPPNHPISPRGLASDMSTVIALLDAMDV